VKALRLCFFWFGLVGFIMGGCQEPSQAKSDSPRLFKIQVNDVELHVELALTEKQWMTGLMKRESLSKNSGMLFVGRQEIRRSFWMKNTYISLDIVYLSSDQKVVSISKAATPLSEAPLWSEGPAQYVLELKAGMADQLGLKKGSQLKFDSQIVKESSVD